MSRFRVQEVKAQRDKRPRRWLQFSLRGVFVLMVVVALGLGWIASERRKVWLEDRAVEEIYPSKGLVLCDVDEEYMNCRWPWDWAAWKQKLLGARVGSPVSSISLHPGSSADVLDELRHMRALRHLDLQRISVGDEHIERILELQSLESLNLSATDITDAGAMRLASLPNLKELYLDHTVITERTLDSFGSLDLETLSICDTNVPIEAAEEYHAEHTHWELEKHYAPCPSAKHRAAAVRLTRQGAFVQTSLPVSVWDPVLKPHDDTELHLPFSVVTFYFPNGRPYRVWVGDVDDLKATADLAHLHTIIVNREVTPDFIRQVSSTGFAEEFCIMDLAGDPTPRPEHLEPLAQCSFSHLTLDLFNWQGQSFDFLPKMQNLRELRLNGCGFVELAPDTAPTRKDRVAGLLTPNPVRVTKREYSALAACPKLETLVLDRVGISKDLLSVLSRCPHVETLAFSGVWLTEGASRGFAELENVRRLRLSLGDIRLPHLAEFPALEELVLDCSMELSDMDLEDLCRHDRLQRLSLSYVNVSDEMLERIASLRELEFLEISGWTDPFPMMEEPSQSQVSPTGLEYLRKLPKLREVHLELDKDDIDPEIVIQFEREIQARATTGDQQPTEDAIQHLQR